MKELYLPEANNDFMFAFIGNPWTLLLFAAVAFVGVFLWKRRKP